MENFENKLGATFTFNDKFGNCISGTIIRGDPLLVKCDDGETYSAYITSGRNYAGDYSLHFKKNGELFSTYLPEGFNIWEIYYKSDLSDYINRTTIKTDFFTKSYFTEDAMKRDYNAMVRNYEIIANTLYGEHKIDYTEREKPYSEEGSREMTFFDDDNCGKRASTRVVCYMTYTKNIKHE